MERGNRKICWKNMARIAQDWQLWKELGKAYVQQWTYKGYCG